MERKIRVLGIAPYEGMKSIMASLSDEFPEMELTLFVGDLERGVEIAQNNFHGNYDVVISRGGTARLLRKHLSLPVIEIEISMYDILCALKLAEGQLAHVAIISYAQTGNNAKMLCSLLGYDIDVYTLDAREDVESTMRQVQQLGYSAVLCDMIANTTAQRMGLNSYLITSGVDSIRQALQNAKLLCRSLERLKNENAFFRQLINGQISDTVVFTENGELFLSTVREGNPELIQLLRQELEETRREPERRIPRMLNGTIYSIQARRIVSGELTYFAFFFTSRKSPMPANQAGLRFYTRPEIERLFYDSIFSFAGTVVDYQEPIAQLNQSSSPIMISGEDGTGQGSVAQLLYIKSALKNNAFISINCGQVSEKSWSYLLEHYDSPLADQGNTIYFSNIDILTPERCQQLLSALNDMDVCRRNRLLCSCVCDSGENMSSIGATIADALGCLSLLLAPLRKNADRIPNLVSLTLSHMNVEMPHPVVGVSPEAMRLMQAFPWPHNYAQFYRVLKELATTSQETVFSENRVSQILQKERHVAVFTPKAEESAIPLDLNRTLDEITRDIARRVLEESGGNQTMAAKRLGISRTTLWRLLKD